MLLPNVRRKVAGIEMSDLINRDDFINSIVCLVSSPCETKQEQRDAQFKQKYTVDAFIKELKRAPAVAAVEVVFCKNCKHRETTRCITPELVNDDDYCSYGERRESEVSE